MKKRDKPQITKENREIRMDRLKDKLKEYYGKGEVKEWVKQLQNIAKKKTRNR